MFNLIGYSKPSSAEKTLAFYEKGVIAAGEADIYAAKARAFEWDIAAGHAILEHAGGSITTHENEFFLYGKNGFKNLPILATRSANLKK